METEDQLSGWNYFKLNKQLLNAIDDVGFSQPTEIQKRCIPIILGGQNIIGIAQTGTGKTASYLIPIIMKVKFARAFGPSALILVPTKELAVQVSDHAKKLCAYTDLRVISIYGGVGTKGQIELLSQGVDIMVATPGRFMELYLKKEIQLKEVKALVIDEADRMMDMGFLPQIRRIFDILPRKRQNLLFSATFPQKVERLAEDFLEFPQKIEVTPQATTAKLVKQVYYEVPNIKSKINFLAYLLSTDKEMNRVLIFAKTKNTANNVYKFIDRKGMGPVRVIHSNKSQNTRLNALKDFSKGEVRVLVATDVSARGIDVSKVSHVINFEVPTQYDDYVHRIGRTGRAFEAGKAITMVTAAEQYHLDKIQELIREKIPMKKVPATVSMEETPFEEAQQMARQIDDQKRREDPSFKGAFHEKKNRR